MKPEPIWLMAMAVLSCAYVRSSSGADVAANFTRVDVEEAVQLVHCGF